MPVAALAFFLAFGGQEEGPQRWCAYRTSAQMQKAARTGETAGEWAEMQWQGGAVTRLLLGTESEDSYVEDTYGLDAAGRVVSLARHGHYINDPFWTATYRPNAKAQPQNGIAKGPSPFARRRQISNTQRPAFIQP